MYLLYSLPHHRSLLSSYLPSYSPSCCRAYTSHGCSQVLIVIVIFTTFISSYSPSSSLTMIIISEPALILLWLKKCCLRSTFFSLNHPQDHLRICTGPAVVKEKTRRVASKSVTSAKILGDQALRSL